MPGMSDPDIPGVCIQRETITLRVFILGSLHERPLTTALWIDSMND
jgi:hypothetical protein